MFSKHRTITPTFGKAESLPPLRRSSIAMSFAHKKHGKRFVDADVMTPITCSLAEFIAQVDERYKVQTRKWQAHAMQALLEGRDVLVHAGTGSGKSLIFESMVLSKKGAVVLVISPTLALMENQVGEQSVQCLMVVRVHEKPRF
jgi:ATP-dependent helicase YprA (DUF1998 family)